MKKQIKIDQRQFLADLLRRVSENENGVRGYLEQAGISVGQHITVANVQQLHATNQKAFEDMLRFLYPELSRANAMGDFTMGDIANLSGVVLSGASSILSMLNINGNTTAISTGQAAAAMAEASKNEEAKAQMRKTITIVCIGFVIITIAGVLIFKNRH